MGEDRNYLEALRDFYARHRVLPSFSTIGELVGLRSKSSVHALVARLKLAGYLDTSPGNRLKPGKRFFERTIADSVRAGLPQPADDSSQEVLTLDEFLIERPSRTVLVRVKGDSMVDAGIHEGDIAVVEKGARAGVGDIVVAVVDDDFTLKYLDRDRDGYFLRPGNPSYPVIRPRGALEIFGVTVGLIRKYR